MKAKDQITNVLLNVKNWILYYMFNIKSRNFIIPNDYKLEYSDDFTKMSIDEFDTKYIRRQFWGDYHPNGLQQWYDPKAVTLNNGLNLSVTQNTKEVTSYNVIGKIMLDNQEPKTIPNGVGLVTSNEAFGYGIYEWNIILPIGSQLWPAIWLTGKDSWPPEIDVIEGYSSDDMRYKRNLNTNIHCGINNQTHYGVGANRHGLFVDKNDTLNLILHWTKDYIKIYYNGFYCRVLTNKDDMKWFTDVEMRVVMNNALREKGLDFRNISVRPLIVKDFKYFS